MTNIYLDDLRNPTNTKPWVILRSSLEAIEYVKKNGMPGYWSFDHDLGGDDTTMIFLKWLIDYDLDNGGMVIPENFSFDVHSANPTGSKNIKGLLDGYMAFKKQNTKKR